MKWKSSNVSLFFQIYEQFPALWNFKDKEYSNKSFRDAVFEGLMSNLKEHHLLGQMDKKQLQAKIKSLKDVYRTELRKIEKSKKSGCVVYVPKLSWFNDASFLNEVMATRRSQSNLDSSQTDNSVKYEEGIDSFDADDPGIGEKITASSSGIMKPFEQPIKRFKKNVSDLPSNEIPRASQQLEEMTTNKSAAEDTYDLFGKYVASELRQLPNRAAILLQQDIHNSITRYKLNTLDNETIK